MFGGANLNLTLAHMLRWQLIKNPGITHQILSTFHPRRAPRYHHHVQCSHVLILGQPVVLLGDVSALPFGVCPQKKPDKLKKFFKKHTFWRERSGRWCLTRVVLASVPSILQDLIRSGSFLSQANPEGFLQLQNTR